MNRVKSAPEHVKGALLRMFYPGHLLDSEEIESVAVELGISVRRLIDELDALCRMQGFKFEVPQP